MERSISDEVYVASGDKESVLDCDNAQNFLIHPDGAIYFLNDYNEDKSYGTLMCAVITSGTVGKPVKIDDDVMRVRFGNEHENIYYFKDIKDNVGDMYLNGKVVATDVYVQSLYNFKGTDTLLYFTDYSSKNECGTLNLYKGGVQTKIADDVAFFAPNDEKNIVYLTDYNQNREKGDLMLYNGGSKPIQIDTDVTALLWKPSMMWGYFNFYWYY